MQDEKTVQTPGDIRLAFEPTFSPHLDFLFILKLSCSTSESVGNCSDLAVSLEDFYT